MFLICHRPFTIARYNFIGCKYTSYPFELQKYLKKSGEWSKYSVKKHRLPSMSPLFYTIFFTNPNSLYGI